MQPDGDLQTNKFAIMVGARTNLNAIAVSVSHAVSRSYVIDMI